MADSDQDTSEHQPESRIRDVDRELLQYFSYLIDPVFKDMFGDPSVAPKRQTIRLEDIQRFGERQKERFAKELAEAARVAIARLK